MATYHVTLNGQGLILDLAQYRKRPAPAFRLAENERVVVRPELPQGTLETSFSSAEDGFSAMRAYQGKLYAGSSGSGKVYEFDGADWTESHDHGASVAGISAMAEWDGTLYVANRTDGQFAALRGDGTAWRFPESTFTGASGIGALVGLPGAEGSARGLLYLVGNRVADTTTAATVRSWDLSTLSANLFRLNERDASGGLAFDGKVLIFGAETSEQGYGSLYRGPAWSIARAVPDAYPIAAAALGEELFVGLDNGIVARASGQRLDPVGLVPGLADMLAFAGAIWCGARDDAHGVHLRRFDGFGWSVPFASQAGAAAGALGLYGSRLYVGSDGDVLRTTSSFAPTGAARRSWDLEALLEGTEALPLLDGTPEPLTGAQLSSGLWSTLAAARPVAFDDLDGASYTVWVTDLHERVARLSQRLGHQTIARLTLVEA